MKKIVLLLNIFLLCSANVLMAQESLDTYSSDFDPSLKRLLNGCVMLARGVQENDCMMVGMAVDSLNRNENIPPKPVVVGNMITTAIDVSALLPIDECFDFSDVYGHEWLEARCGAPVVDLPPLMRSFPSECKVIRMRLAPKSSATYSVKMRGKCHLFAIGEPGSIIGLDIREESNPEINPVKYGDNLLVATWVAPTVKAAHTLTISNDTETPATIYVYSN